MNYFSKRTTPKFLWLILTGMTIALSCTKDQDYLEEAILENSETQDIKIEATVIENKVNLQASVAKAANTTKSGLRAIGTPSVSSGKAPLAVTFEGGSTKNKSEIAKWNWTFGDGNRSGNKNPSHTFQKAGTYNVSFEVIGKNGESSIQTIQIKATGSTSGSSDSSNGFSAIGTPSKTTGKAPFEVSFLGSSSKAKKDIRKWNWTFGDGNRSGNKNPTHTFKNAGTYNVKFEVIDNNGKTANQIITITATGESTSGSENDNGDSNSGENSGLKATGTSSTISGKAPLNITFSGNSSVNKSNIVKWNWTFGDGDRSGNKNPNHTFTKAGNYDVILTVIDKNGKSATDKMTIKVSDSSSDSGDSSNENTTPKKGSYPSNAVFASDYGYNSKDATDALEKALRSGKSYVVVDKQSSDWIIRPLSLFDLRDMTIVFEPGVTLRAKSGAFGRTNDQLFKLSRARNVTIEGYGATFKMNKSEYSNGEHRHALAINKCNDVTVRGLTLRDSGGDGILIAGMETGSYSQNITIEDVVSTNNKRLGMGIISAQNVWVKNSKFLNTTGTLPEAGVDLEPNHSNERLVNINFTGCEFSNNDHMGFFLSTGKLNSSSVPVSVKISNSEFSQNAKSPNDKRPKAGITLSQGITNNPVKGEIVFENILFDGGDHRIIFSNKSANSFRAVFKDCIARNVTKQGNSAVIGLEALSTTSTLGGFVFDNFQIQFSSDVNFMQIRAPKSHIVKDIKGDFRIKEPNDNPLDYAGSYSTSRNQNVSIKYNHVN